MSGRAFPAAPPALATRPGLAREVAVLLKLAAPLASAQAGLALMGLIDIAVVGRVGMRPLAAVGLGNALFFGLAFGATGAMMGLEPLIAQAVGAGDRPRARELLWQSLWLALLVSAIVAVPLACLPSMLAPVGIEPAVADDARRFLFARLPGLPFLLGFVGLRSYLQAEGKTRALVLGTVAANLANLLLDLLFVLGGAGLPGWTGPLRRVPAWGALGAGVATSLSGLALFLVLLLACRPAFAARGDDGARRSRSPHWTDLRAALRVGTPVALQMTAEVSVFSIVGVLAGQLGALSLAAHQLVLVVASFTFCLATGIGSAGSVLVGWAVGAGDGHAARRSGVLALACGTVLMTASGLLFWFAPGAVARIFSQDPAVIAASIPVFAVAAVFQISDGVQSVGAGVLRGAGDTRFSFLANLFGHYAIGLPLALVLGFSLHRGILGLWWGLCAGLTAVAVALLARFLQVSGRPIAPLERHPKAG